MTVGAVGAMALPPAAAALIGAVGWRSAFASLGAMVLAIGLPLGFHVQRPPRRRGRRIASRPGSSVREGLRSAFSGSSSPYCFALPSARMARLRISRSWNLVSGCGIGRFRDGLVDSGRAARHGMAARPLFRSVRGLLLTRHRFRWCDSAGGRAFAVCARCGNCFDRIWQGRRGGRNTLSDLPNISACGLSPLCTALLGRHARSVQSSWAEHSILPARIRRFSRNLQR